MLSMNRTSRHEVGLPEATQKGKSDHRRLGIRADSNTPGDKSQIAFVFPNLNCSGSRLTACKIMSAHFRSSSVLETRAGARILYLESVQSRGEGQTKEQRQTDKKIEINPQLNQSSSTYS